MKFISNHIDRIDTSDFNNVDNELLDSYSRTIVDVAKKVSPSVVKESVVKKEMPNAGQRNNIRPMEADASGFIISSDGLLITNIHVAGD